MRALVFKKGLSFIDDYPQPVLNDNLEIIKGYMGFSGIPGHEFAGVVEKSSDSELVGKRVAGEINIGCGTCTYCHRGLGNHCSDLQ